MSARQPRPAASFAARSKRWISSAARPEPKGSQNAQRSYERYLALARAEALIGNTVGAENYLAGLSARSTPTWSHLAATTTVPLVMVAVDYDPLALGFIKSLAQPGGNVTGVYVQQLDLAKKRVELLTQALLSQVGVSSNCVSQHTFTRALTQRAKRAQVSRE
jgi:ABC-type uncharacterized transport system substrate-binding protein